MQSFEQPHDVTVSRDGIDVYVGDLGAKPTVYKFHRNMQSADDTVGMNAAGEDVDTETQI